MPDPTLDKKTESINALKNANRHLSELLGDLNKKDQIMAKVSSDLEYVSRQLGAILIKAYIGSEHKVLPLGEYLKELSSKLNEAR